MSTFKSAEYPPLEEWDWKRYGKTGKEDVIEFIMGFKDRKFFVGTDSKLYPKKKSTTFTTVLIAYEMGKGGAVLTHTDNVGFMDSLRQRLLMEAMRSLEVAWLLDRLIEQTSFIGVHLDVNQNLKFRSGQYKDELVGMVMGQGFKCLTKPDAWAASSCADKIC